MIICFTSAALERLHFGSLHVLEIVGARCSCLGLPGAALNVLKSLASSGVVQPGHCAIVGFDDIQEFADHLHLDE